MIWGSKYLSTQTKYKYLIYIVNPDVRVYLNYEELRMFYKKLKLIGDPEIKIFGGDATSPIYPQYISVASLEQLQALVTHKARE